MTKKIGIIAAMPVEIERFVKEVGAAEKTIKGFYKVYEGKRDGNDVILACSGIGKVNAAACTQKLIDCYGVDCVINMGIAGGISKELKTLDVVIGSEVTYHDFSPAELLDRYHPFTRIFNCDEGLMSIAEKACSDCPEVERFLKGRIASGDCFVESNETKAYIREELKALCCEMEGASIGHVCHLNGVPFLILRSISDLADEDAQMSYSEFEEKAAVQANRVVMKMIGMI